MATKQNTIDLVIRSKLQGVPDIKKVSDAVDALSNSVNSQTKNVVKNVDAFDKLKSTRSQLSNIASEVAELNKLTDAYEKSKVALQTNSEKLEQQQAQLKSLSEQMSKSNSVSQTKIDKEAALTRAIEKTKQAIDAETKSQAELVGLLQKAGINTAEYAAFLDKLRNITNQTAVAMSNARNKMNEVNTAQENGVKLQRTSLDLYQRVRGQLLSITAGYFGLYGAMDLVNKSVAAQGAKESVIAQLGIASGDAKAASKEYEYLVSLAQKLGLEIGAIAPGFAKLSTSMTLSGKSAAETRFVFESFAETSRALKFTNEQVDRGIYAMSQIFSKGRVMAEEFNGQLGDLLPGLQGVAKEATKDRFKDFNKAMSEGKVTTADFIRIMAIYREKMQGPLSQAIKSVQADQARLNNEITLFQQALAENGVSEEYRKIIIELTEFFKSPDGANFAKNLAEAFRMVGVVLRFVIENFDTLSTIIASYVGVKFMAGAIKELIYFQSLLKSTPALIGNIVGFIQKWGTKLAVFGRGGIIGLVVFGTFALADLLYEQVPAVKKAVDTLVKTLNLDFGGSFEKTAKQAAVRVKKYAQIIAENSKLSRGAITPDQYNKNVSDINAAFATESKAIWAAPKAQAKLPSTGSTPVTPSKTQTEIDFYKSLTSGSTTAAASDSTLGKAKKKLDSIAQSLVELESRVKKTTSDSLDEKVRAIDSEFSRLDRNIQSITNKRIRNAMSDRLNTARELLKKEVFDDFIKTVDDGLKSLETKVQTKAADTLVEKVNAIDSQFFQMEAKIEQITDAHLKSQYSDRLVKAREQLKIEVIQDYQKKMLESKQALEQDILNAEAETGRKSKLDLDKRLAAVDQKYADSFKKIADQRKLLVEANMADPTLDSQENRLIIAVKENKELETRKYYLEEAARLEKQVNDLVQARDSRLRSIEIQKDTGALTEMQVLQETAKVVASSQPGIEVAAQQFRDFVESNKASFGTEAQAQLQEYINKVEELSASSSRLRTQVLTVRDVNERLAEGGKEVFASLADGLAGVITGANSLGDAFEGVGVTFTKFVAQFLRDIGLMIAKQAIFNAIKSSGFGSNGGFAGTIATAVSALVKHSGGTVGQSSNRTRSVPAAVFSNAPRYHTGGMAGLKPDEYATILQKNEEVLSADDPRNVRNMATQGQQASVNVNPTNIVAISESDIQNAAFGGGVERRLLNIISVNRSKFKAALGT